ncbi:MAG: TonB-dependent receptor [Gemmatimonadaceae bacterium]
MLGLARSVLAVAPLLASLLLTTPALAQPQGRISGTVRDATGAPIGSARVAATNAVTGTTRTAVTDANGSYAIAQLAPGAYAVSASQFGYRRTVRADVRVSGETTVDLVLELLPLQAVTVTATLREQELADVPFSIAAPTASMLRDRGAENIEAIAVNVAGFSVQNLGPGQSQVAMRGTSSGQIARDQPGVKEQVGAYLDDSPISLSLFTPDLDLFDVSRVEVLRGPQGTLFGAGSLSGTVRYITNQPELGVRSTFGELGAHAIGDGGAGGSFKIGTNVPLGERAAARVAVYQNLIGGYMDAVQPDLSVDRNVNSGERTGARAAVLFAPNARFTITPRVIAQRVQTDGWNRHDAFNILANPFTTSRPDVTLGPRQLFTQIEEPFTDDFVMGDVNLRYDFGPAALTSITSYTYRDILVVRDAGALTSSITGGSIGLAEEVYTLNAPLNDATVSKVLTQEVRLAGDIAQGRLRWLGGGFYSTNDREYHQRLLVSGFEAATGIATEGLRAPRDVLFYSDLAYDLRQGAVFGEATVSVTPRFDLTGGLRYYNFSEDREQVFDGIFAHDNTGTAIVSQPGSTNASGFAPRFIASFRPTDNLTLNALASRGFRLGGINDPLNVPLCTPQDLQTFSGRDTWEDETAWNYEAGMKSQWMGGRASLNISAFYMDIRDLQLTVTAGSCSSRLIFNVPKAVSQGAEIELAVAPTPFFDAALSLSLNDAELKSTVTTTDGAGNTTVLAGIEEGNRLPSVPRVQVAGAATLRRPWRAAGAGTNAFVTVSAQHVGSRFTQIEDLTPGIGTVNINSFAPNTIGGPLTQNTFTFDPILPSYTLANLRFGVNRGNWETALFVNNITDERALLSLDRERGLRARVGYLTNQPRTYGVTLRFEY